MTEQDRERIEAIVREEQRKYGLRPKIAPLKDEFGVRVYGYGRAPGRVWIWALITFVAAGLGGWFGWVYGGAGGERLFDMPNAVIIGKIIFSVLLIAGAVTFIRTIAVRFLERLIEPRFEIALTRKAIEIGGWGGYEEYLREGVRAQFKVETHKGAKDEHVASTMSGKQLGTGRYAQTEQIVVYLGQTRIPVTEICRDEVGASSIRWRLDRLNDEIMGITAQHGF